MAFKLDLIGDIYAKLLYNDKCTVSRLKLVKNEYGATKPDSREEIYKDMPCKFSFSSIDVPEDGNTVYVPVIKEVKIFTDLKYDIKAGDLLSGYRKDLTNSINQKIEGVCGEPTRFESHQEISIQIKGEN